jgi:hypothetical protein
MIELNHHSACVLPWYQTESDIWVMVEQKDAGFRHPYFDNGLNFLGGNWKKGQDSDESPLDLAIREIGEEFWLTADAHESTNALLGQEFLKGDQSDTGAHDEKPEDRIKDLGRMLQQGLSSGGNYIVTVSPPIADPRVVYANSVFLRQLSTKEYLDARRIVDGFYGKITTDNHRRDNKTVFVALDQINGENMKFAWGYGKILNEIIRAGYLPVTESIIRPLAQIGVEQMLLPGGVSKRPSGILTFDGVEKAGYSYRE